MEWQATLTFRCSEQYFTKACTQKFTVELGKADMLILAHSLPSSLLPSLSSRALLACLKKNNKKSEFTPSPFETQHVSDR
jgi:hypothetical protein